MFRLAVQRRPCGSAGLASIVANSGSSISPLGRVSSNVRNVLNQSTTDMQHIRQRHHFLRRMRNHYDYYQETALRRLNYEREELVFRALIATNFLVFLNWQYGWPLSRKRMNQFFVASTRGVFYEHNILSLVGSAFSHAEPMHLLANMMTFYFFGRDVFHAMGKRLAVGMYLFAGAAAAYAQVYQGKRHSFDAHILGASGAVSSFVVFSILANPSATILVWFFFPIPAALFGAAYILQDIWGLSHRQTYHGAWIGHEAHLTGSVVGALAFFAKRRYWI